MQLCACIRSKLLGYACCFRPHCRGRQRLGLTLLQPAPPTPHRFSAGMIAGGSGITPMFQVGSAAAAAAFPLLCCGIPTALLLLALLALLLLLLLADCCHRRRCCLGPTCDCCCCGRSCHRGLAPHACLRLSLLTAAAQ